MYCFFIVHRAVSFPSGCKVDNNTIFYFCNTSSRDFHNHGNIFKMTDTRINICYYLYSLSNRSVIFTPRAMAIFSSWASVGETLSFSILLMVDLLIPALFANCTNVIPLLFLADHVNMCNIHHPSYSIHLVLIATDIIAICINSILI